MTMHACQVDCRCLKTARTVARPTSQLGASLSLALRPLLPRKTFSILSLIRLKKCKIVMMMTRMILQGVQFQDIVSINFSLSIDPKDKVTQSDIKTLGSIVV